MKNLLASSTLNTLGLQSGIPTYMSMYMVLLKWICFAVKLSSMFLVSHILTFSISKTQIRVWNCCSEFSQNQIFKNLQIAILYSEQSKTIDIPFSKTVFIVFHCPIRPKWQAGVWMSEKKIYDGWRILLSKGWACENQLWGGGSEGHLDWWVSVWTASKTSIGSDCPWRANAVPEESVAL